MALNSKHTVSLKDALEVVPYYDGSNIPFTHFSRACNEAKEMIPPEAEVNLAKLIRIRLLGIPRRVIEDRSYDKVSDLLIYLQKIFGSPKSLCQLQGELGNIYQNKSETVISYATRVRDLGHEIQEAHKLNNNSNIDNAFKILIEKEMLTCFMNGLLPEVERRMRNYNSIDETIQEAIYIEKRLKTISLIRRGDEINNSNNQTECRSNIENCQICSQRGHSAINCNYRYQNSIENPRSNLEFDVIKCEICNIRGHVASKCRLHEQRRIEEQPVKYTRESLSCQMANDFGHTTDKCLQSRRSRTFAEIEQRSCQLCHQYGHTADRCRRSQSLINCQICKKPGHSAQKCCQIQQNNFIVQQSMCQSCNQIGHTAEMCFNKNIMFTSLSEEAVKCRYCKESGHIVGNCLRKKGADQRKLEQGNGTNRQIKSSSKNYTASTKKVNIEAQRKTKEKNSVQHDTSITDKCLYKIESVDCNSTTNNKGSKIDYSRNGICTSGMEIPFIQRPMISSSDSLFDAKNKIYMPDTEVLRYETQKEIERTNIVQYNKNFDEKYLPRTEISIKERLGKPRILDKDCSTQTKILGEEYLLKTGIFDGDCLLRTEKSNEEDIESLDVSDESLATLEIPRKGGGNTERNRRLSNDI